MVKKNSVCGYCISIIEYQFTRNCLLSVQQENFTVVNVTVYKQENETY